MNYPIIVSVIVLTYNQAPFIAQALDSVLMQKTDFDYEILVGDDASTDGTSDIVKSYGEKYPDRFRVFVREKNCGATRNAYELLMQAQGKYLAFCEGDDYWTSDNKLALQVKYLENHPDMIGCAHKCSIVNEEGIPMPDERLLWVKEKAVFTLDDFQGIYLPGQTATIVKRNIFRDSDEDYSFLYTSNPAISDRTSTLLFLSRGNFGFLPQVLSAYRRRSKGNLTTIAYESNDNRLADEWQYTQTLEKLAGDLTGRDDVFMPFCHQLYASTLLQLLRSPTKEHYALFRDIGEHIGKGAFHPLALLDGIRRKLEYKYFSGRIKEDKSLEK